MDRDGRTRLIEVDLQNYSLEHVLPIYQRLIEHAINSQDREHWHLAQAALKALEGREDQKVSEFLESLLQPTKRNNHFLYQFINHSHQVVLSKLQNKA